MYFYIMNVNKVNSDFNMFYILASVHTDSNGGSAGRYVLLFVYLKVHILYLSVCDCVHFIPNLYYTE